MSLNEFWQEAKKMKVFSNEFDNMRAIPQFFRSIRPIFLTCTFVGMIGLFEQQFKMFHELQEQMKKIELKDPNTYTQEDKIILYKAKHSTDVTMPLYGKLKIWWLNHYFQYLDLIPLENSDYQQLKKEYGN